MGEDIVVLQKKAPGSIRLSKQEVLVYQKKTMNSWKHKSDSWPITRGHILVGLAGAASAMFFTSFYRRGLKLGKYGRKTNYLTTMFSTGCVTGLFHSVFITDSILTDNVSCSACLEVKASVVQTVFGLIYPLILTPIVSFSLSELYQTYPLPNIKLAPRELIKVWYKITRPAFGQFRTLLFVQVVLAAGITYLEQKSCSYITLHMLKGDVTN